MRKNTSTKSGQSLTEYVILIMVISGMGTLLFRKMPEFLDLVEKPIRDPIVRTYKYGDPKACGFSDTVPECSGPERHALIRQGGNFRMFGRRIVDE